MTGVPVLRVARPSDDLERIARMYMEGLGLEVIGRFEDHDGFDGVILGRDGAPYHLEFTKKRGAPPGIAVSDEHLLVFYVPDRAEWAATCLRMARAGFRNAKSGNPYWDVCGKTFVDGDGARVVLQNADDKQITSPGGRSSLPESPRSTPSPYRRPG